jgi:SAM-dependent methyltransferase
MVTDAHRGMTPSQWVQRWTHLISAGGTILDVACGAGRHVRWFARLGFRVTAIDRDEQAMRPLSDVAELIVADIEAGPWPLASRHFDGVLVTNYLWRENLPDVVASVAAGGVLIYETFADGNETVGKPSNPKFLLRAGELLEATRGLRVVAYEDGFEDGSTSDFGAAGQRFVQRIAAVRESGHDARAKRYLLRPSTGSAGQVKSSDSEDLP